MLTLILLVVLGGGAGLLAVSLIDSRGLARLLRRAERPSLRASTTPGTPAPASEPDAAPGPDAASAHAVAEAVDPPAADPTGVVVVHDARESIEPRRHPRPRRRAAGALPAALTAVEGSHREVAHVSAWRQTVSLLSLAAIVVVLGVAVAAVAGVAIGTAAELLDGTVG